MKKYLFLLIGIAAVESSVYSQDLHFSQFNETPSLVNPALTGSQYVMRASIIYKDQWGSVTVPYRTYGASYDMKFKASSWEKNRSLQNKNLQKSIQPLSRWIVVF